MSRSPLKPGVLSLRLKQQQEEREATAARASTTATAEAVEIRQAVEVAREVVTQREPAANADGDDEAPTNAAVKQAAEARQRDHHKRLREAAARLDVRECQWGRGRLVVTRPTGRVDLLGVESEQARDYVRAALGAEARVTPTAIDEVLSRARAQAREAARTCFVNLRIARRADSEACVVDLADSTEKVVEIKPHRDGRAVAIVRQEDTGVLFQRGGDLGPLPEPVVTDAKAAWDLLRTFLAVAGVKDLDVQAQLIVWLAEALRYGTPKPVLEILGPPGAAKSTLATALSNLVDPSKSLRRGSVAFEQSHLAAAVQTAHVLNADNLSTLRGEEQDNLCQVSTGGAFKARKLYAQDEVYVAAVQNPLVLTAVTKVVTRSDAMMRTITVRLAARTGGGFRSEEDLQQEFKAAHAGLFGAVCAVLSAGLNLLPAVKQQQVWRARMVDYAQLGEAVTQSVGWPAGKFADTLDRAKVAAAQQAAADDPLLSAVLAVVGELGRNPQPAAPPTKTWAEAASGGAAWTVSGGRVMVAIRLKNLRAAVARRGDDLSAFAPRWLPDTERALRNAMDLRQPTWSALGYDLGWKQTRDKLTAAVFLLP